MTNSPSLPTPSRWLPTLLAISIFMQMLDATILNTALPKMAADLHESPLNMQSAVIAYALALALFMPLSGYLSDRYGSKNVFMTAMALFILGSLLCALSPNLPLLVGARVIQGMGGAMLMPVPRLVVLRAYDISQLLTIMNYIIMPALLGPILGPLLGGYLVEYASWHWIFLINLPIGLLGLWMSHKIMPNFYAPNHQPLHFDGLGFFFFGLAAVGLSLSVEMLMHPNAQLLALLSGSLGIMGLCLYIQHAKRRAEQALYSPKLLWIRTFRLGIIGNLCCRLGMAAVPFLLPLLLQVAFGRRADIAGWTLAPIACAALLTKPLIKPVIHRFGYRNILIWNTRLIGVIIMLLALPDANTPLWLFIPVLFCLGMCNSLQYSAMNTLTLADLRPHQTGSGNSLMAVNQQLAISFGIALGALLLNYFSHLPSQSTQLHLAFRQTFVIIGSITFCSSWVFKRLHTLDGTNLLSPPK